MINNEVKVALLEEELREFIESMKYQYGDNYKDYPEVRARIEVIENMIKIIKEG